MNQMPDWGTPNRYWAIYWRDSVTSRPIFSVEVKHDGTVLIEGDPAKMETDGLTM